MKFGCQESLCRVSKTFGYYEHGITNLFPWFKACDIAADRAGSISPSPMSAGTLRRCSSMNF